MNDMFDDLKAIKTKLKKDESSDNVTKPKHSKSKDILMKEKEDELKADFLDYMKNTEVKKI